MLVKYNVYLVAYTVAYTSEIIGLYLWILFSLLLFLFRALQTLEISYNISVCVYIFTLRFFYATKYLKM